MRLSVAEQKRLLDALPSHRKMTIQRTCHACQQRGEGIKDIMKKAKNALGPIASEIGPLALKHLIMPMLLKKMGIAGNGAKKTVRIKKKTKIIY